MHDVINWFEIPAIDIERAAAFYRSIFGIQLDVSGGDGYAMAIFPHEGGVGGGLVMADGYTPNGNGSLIYFNANPDLSIVLGRVQRAGGQVVKPKTDIGENGYFAIFLDTEGNRIALHSMN